jgi:hypothetical protein
MGSLEQEHRDKRGIKENGPVNFRTQQEKDSNRGENPIPAHRIKHIFDMLIRYLSPKKIQSCITCLTIVQLAEVFYLIT